MHEMAIVESVFEQISDKLPGKSIGLVRLEIGEMYGVLPDAIRFCFGLAADGTAFQGAELELVDVPADCRCDACGTRFRPADAMPLCTCGSSEVTVLAGGDMKITAVGVVESV